MAKYGDRVRAVVIHEVRAVTDPGRVDGMLLVSNYAEAAARLFNAGVIDEASARRTMIAAQSEGLNLTDAGIDALIAAHRPTR